MNGKLTRKQLREREQRRPRAVGDEVFCLVLEKSGKDRSTIVDIARARVLAAPASSLAQHEPDAIELQITLASHPWRIGRTIRKAWQALYLINDPVEHRAFGDFIRLLYGDASDHAPVALESLPFTERTTT